MSDNGAEYSRVGGDHDEQGDEVDGAEEEERECRDRPLVGPEGHALLLLRISGSLLSMPDKRLKIRKLNFDRISSSLKV